MRRILAASLAVLMTSCSPSAATLAPTPPGSTLVNLAPVTEALASPSSPEVTPVSSTPQSAELHWVLVADGLAQPVAVAHTDDDRLFVVERGGAIRIIQGGALAPEPFLDIGTLVVTRNTEQGLLGLVFHPRFRQNGFFYVDYTDVRGNTVIARYHADPGSMTADPSSEHVILRIQQPYPNHNGGQLAFGPDGELYVGLGDGGSEGDPNGNGQSLDTLLAKILRIDVDAAEPYGIPADNPFAHGGGRPEIWAYGLRNPWRFSFDRLTGDLYIGDVGQDAWEEIDFQPAGSPGGANYGWNLREGLHAYTSDSTSGLVDPVAEYSHDQGCAVIGGTVIRSPSLPDWRGTYLLGDYCTGRIWGMTRAGSQWQTRLLFETAYHITSFGEDQNGEIYLADFGGSLLRLQPASQP